jgi:hypothetical protein
MQSTPSRHVTRDGSLGILSRPPLGIPHGLFPWGFPTESLYELFVFPLSANVLAVSLFLVQSF